jgi:hypothetical protein
MTAPLLDEVTRAELARIRCERIRRERQDGYREHDGPKPKPLPSGLAVRIPLWLHADAAADHGTERDDCRDRDGNPVDTVGDLQHQRSMASARPA